MFNEMDPGTYSTINYTAMKLMNFRHFECNFIIHGLYFHDSPCSKGPSNQLTKRRSGQVKIITYH